jgi:hypothetical protein
MKYVRLKTSRVYHKVDRFLLNHRWKIASVCNSLARLASEVEVSNKPPTNCRPCKRCFKDAAIEAAIEESRKLSRELDDAGRLRPDQLDEEISK